MFPIWGWGQGVNASREELEDPAQAPRIAREMVAPAHAWWRRRPGWSPELFGAAAAP
jgi:hypothetical protein